MLRPMPRERSVTRPSPELVNARVAQVAARQWGVVDVADLHACGLSDDAIATRVRHSALFPLYRGVYALAHPNVPFEAWCLAAVKACGEGAALSHYAAAVLWGMLEPFGRNPDVVAPTIKRHDGINTHRAASFERTFHKGIPITTPAQTLIHISALAQFKTLRSATNEALNRRLITPLDLITSNHRGAKNLRKVLATAAPTRSENENAVLHLLHEAGIPKPLVNPSIRGTTLIPDFLWPPRRLILEADSRTYHDNLLARADDRTKTRVFESLGYTVIRTSWAEITSRPDRMLARVQRALTRADPSGALALRSA